MKVLVTGAGGLIGSATCRKWLAEGHEVFGIDCDARMKWFGKSASVMPVIRELSARENYSHYGVDISSRSDVAYVVEKVLPDVIVHAAAQPSHDKAASIPFDDFETNAVGTLNLLESARTLCKDPIFIHMSTNKVYGDGPNHVSLVETARRYDIQDPSLENGFNETFPIDNCLHSLFGASKVAADVMAQEYGRYFGMKVGIFRGGCLTGPQHRGVELHGFLSYIIKCAVHGAPYKIFGYKGKQVRDQIHCDDVVSCFENFLKAPRCGEVYNLGGGKSNSASIIEVIDELEKTHGLKLSTSYCSDNRTGDHICYYTDMTKFENHFPDWRMKWSLQDIINQIVETERAAS